MLNKHNVLHKSLYTLHKNAQRSQSEPLKQLCNAIVVIVAGADDIPQCPDLGQSVGHHGGHTGPGQHGAVVVAVADGKGGLPGDAEPVGQSQQGGTEWHFLMAASTLVVLPIIILFFFTQKTFIEGISMTGIKG